MSPKGTLRICDNGHRFYKSSDCPTCPFCEEMQKPENGFLADLPAPARRALENQNITTLKKLAGCTEKDILKLHGMGPASLPKLKNALKKSGLKFKSE
jgi:DNA-directed RNA polymerase alpha subunit